MASRGGLPPRAPPSSIQSRAAPSTGMGSLFDMWYLQRLAPRARFFTEHSRLCSSTKHTHTRTQSEATQKAEWSQWVCIHFIETLNNRYFRVVGAGSGFGSRGGPPTSTQRPRPPIRSRYVNTPIICEKIDTIVKEILFKKRDSAAHVSFFIFFRCLFYWLLFVFMIGQTLSIHPLLPICVLRNVVFACYVI